jgi:hypothetical protein
VSIEIYSPPYLHASPRTATPANLPSSVAYGSTLTISNTIAPVTIVAVGDINIDQGLDQHSNSDITSLNGSITIGQAVDGPATAMLRAPNGSIAIGQKVAGGAQ